jgi:hypothetical protein
VFCERSRARSLLIEAYLREPASAERVDNVLQDFKRVGIHRPSCTAVIDLATDAGLSGEAATLLADVIAFRIEDQDGAAQ